MTDTKQNVEGFMKSRGYTRDENGKWYNKVNVKVTKPEPKETILEFEEFKIEKGKRISGDCHHLATLAEGFIRLVFNDERYSEEEIDFDYITSKASTLLTVLTGLPPVAAYELTTDVLDDIKEGLKDG